MEMIIGPILFFTFLFISIRHFIKVKRFNASVPEQFKIKHDGCNHNSEFLVNMRKKDEMWNDFATNPIYSNRSGNIHNRH